MTGKTKKGVKPWLLTVYVPAASGEEVAIPTRHKEARDAAKVATAMLADTGALRYVLVRDLDPETGERLV